MTSKKWLAAAKNGYIIISVLICILGGTLIAFPDFSMILLCRLGGILLLLFGAAKILGYLSRDLYRLAFQFDLAFGILLMVLGFMLIFRVQVVIPAMSVLWGIFILADGLLKIQIALDAKAFGIRRWWLIFLFALAAGLMGFLLVFRPYASARLLMILLGISLLAEGVLNIITILTAVETIKKHAPVDVDYEECQE